MMTLGQLRTVCTTTVGAGRAGLFHPWLQVYLPLYDINTPEREAAFIAQILHESGEFRWVRELGGDAYLAKYDTGALAARLGNTPEPDGDGQRYRGRGLIQITGLYNYARCGEALDIDALGAPELLETPQYAVASACWFWQRAGLNALADQDRFGVITRRINGGLNGYEDRCRYHRRARAALGITQGIVE